MRPYPVGILEKLYALSADDPIYALLTVTHPDLTTRRHVRWYTDVTSNALSFIAAAFDVILPEESEDGQAIGTLLIDVVNQSLIADILAAGTPPTVKIEIVHQSDPDEVVASWTMLARVASWELPRADVELHVGPVLDEAIPYWHFTPHRFPGLFDA